MDTGTFERIAQDLVALFDQQMQAIVGRTFNDLTGDEMAAYEIRRRRILELRSQLESLRKR